MALPKPIVRAARRRRTAEGWLRTIAYTAVLVAFAWFVASVGVWAIVGLLRLVLAATGWL
jgi:hypothetical protein